MSVDTAVNLMTVFRASSAVKRFHVMRTTRNQTVGEHSHGVAVLVTLVEPNCSAALLKAALTHDFHERATGDMPTTAKWMFPALEDAMEKAEALWNKAHGLEYALSEKEQLILRFCDYMDLLLFCTEELELGNRYATEGASNIIGVLGSMTMPNDTARRLRDAACEKANNIIFRIG